MVHFCNVPKHPPFHPYAGLQGLLTDWDKDQHELASQLQEISERTNELHEGQQSADATATFVQGVCARLKRVGPGQTCDDPLLSIGRELISCSSPTPLQVTACDGQVHARFK